MGSLLESFWPHYGLGINSASNRNEYQEYLLGVELASAECLEILAGSDSWSPKGLFRPVMR